MSLARSRSKIFSFVAFIPLIAIACSRMESAEVSTKNTSEGILGGKTVTKETAISSKLVFIVAERSDDQMNFCTGSLLPNNLVLTAAHCLDEASGNVYVNFGLKFTSTDGLKSGTNVRKVVGYRVQPAYSKAKKGEDQRGLDVALLKFAGALPKGFTTFPMPDDQTVKLDIADADTVIQIGYGIRSWIENRVGTLEMRSVKGDQTANWSGKSWSIAATDGGFCDGDSGGPLVSVVNGEPQILGVASRVVNQDHEALEKCIGDDFYTRLAPSLGWMQSSARELGSISE